MCCVLTSSVDDDEEDATDTDGEGELTLDPSSIKVSRKLDSLLYLLATPMASRSFCTAAVRPRGAGISRGKYGG